MTGPTCTCGHPKTTHIANNGPCRPGFNCTCTRYTNQIGTDTFARIALGEQLRNQAITQAETAADPDWKNQAKNIITQLAQTRPEFCADDVWDHGLPKPREPRALGPMMLWALRNNIIEKTGRYIPTTQPTSHRSPTEIMRSLIYNNGTTT